LFHQVQDGEDEGELEDGLHGRVGLRIEVAVEGGVGEGAGDGEFAFGFGGYGLDLLLQGLGVERDGEKGEQEGQAGGVQGGLRAGLRWIRWYWVWGKE
jgi:hypothetical protein